METGLKCRLLQELTGAAAAAAVVNTIDLLLIGRAFSGARAPTRPTTAAAAAEAAAAGLCALVSRARFCLCGASVPLSTRALRFSAYQRFAFGRRRRPAAASASVSVVRPSDVGQQTSSLFLRLPAAAL